MKKIKTTAVIIQGMTVGSQFLPELSTQEYSDVYNGKTLKILPPPGKGFKWELIPQPDKLIAIKVKA